MISDHWQMHQCAVGFNIQSVTLWVFNVFHLWTIHWIPPSQDLDVLQHLQQTVKCRMYRYLKMNIVIFHTYYR